MPMDLSSLHEIAIRMVAPGKGLLAADESTGTIQKRFDAIQVENTEPNRRAYREFMFRDAQAMQHISGVILFDETIKQNAQDGTPLIKIIEDAGSLPGIKVDEGAKPLPAFPGETITYGLDGLPARLKDYRARGARFAKWRGVIDIAAGVPTAGAVRANAQALARYANLCQAADIVPIVEPEVLMDGDHDIDRCEEVTRFTLRTVFDELVHLRVALEGMILKPNMIVPGLAGAQRCTPAQVGERTAAVLKACVPAAVPGVAFLSGGQEDVEATANLDAVNRTGALPWPVTFSYGRALQHAAQKAWGGKPDNVEAAQAAFTHRAAMNGLAAKGEWTPAAEKAG